MLRKVHNCWRFGRNDLEVKEIHGVLDLLSNTILPRLLIPAIPHSSRDARVASLLA